VYITVKETNDIICIYIIKLLNVYQIINVVNKDEYAEYDALALTV
jgi:hypothetical protein